MQASFDFRVQNAGNITVAYCADSRVTSGYAFVSKRKSTTDQVTERTSSVHCKRKRGDWHGLNSRNFLNSATEQAVNLLSSSLDEALLNRYHYFSFRIQFGIAPPWCN